MPSLRVRPELVAAEVRGLVARAQAGDRVAFGQLYGRYVDQVRRFVRGRVADRVLAEDLTSETFVRALRSINCFTWQGADFGAWLMVIARSVITDHVKSARVRREWSVADMRDADRPDVHVEADPAQAAVDRITHQTLLAAVRRLPAAQRRCVALRYLLGLSIAETAALMGRTESAVKMLQRRAVQALRRLLPETAVMPV